MIFEDNTVVGEGGALYSISLGQISVHNNSHLRFINNTARYYICILV